MSHFDERINNLKKLTPQIIASLMEDLNDRAVAITLTSLLEEAIALCIACRFRHDPSNSELDALFEGYGPLATLSAKILVGFALGALTSEMKADLNVIKKLRNDFAHAYLPVTFEDAAISARCAALKLTTEPRPAWEKSFGTGSRGLFVRSCAKLLVLLMVKAAQGVAETHTLKQQRDKILQATRDELTPKGKE